MHTLIIILIMIACSQVANATVYKCETTGGEIYYQSMYCQHADDVQSVVKIKPDPISNRTNKKPVYLQDLKKKQQQKQRQKQRQQRAAKKKEQQETKRRLRLQAKCEKVTQQINQVSQRYRNGYTLKQGITLDRKLAEYKIKRQKYCTNE